MAEVEVKLQVIVSSFCLLTKRSCICKERICIDTLSWTSTLITAIICQTSTQIRVPSTTSFCRVDKSPLDIFFVESFYILIHCFLLVAFKLWVIYIFLSIEHINITLIDHITQYAKTSIPFDVFPNGSFYIRSKTEKIAFIFIECTRLILLQNTHLCWVLFPFVEILVINGLIAIKTIEITHSIWLICRIQCQTMVRDQILTIIVHTENSIVFGGISRLCIDRVDIFRIL